MEVQSFLQGDLVDQLENMSVFEATLDLAKVIPGKLWKVR
jgi:hypothetical protein